MLRVLAVIRRVFLAGTVSLLVITILLLNKYEGLAFQYSDVIGTVYLLFTMVSPVFGIIFWIISAACIRHRGISAAYQQTVSFFNTMFQIVKSDISSPFRLIAAQFVSKKKVEQQYRNAIQSDLATALASGSVAINRLRLIYMLLRFVIYIIGIITGVSVIHNTI